MACQHSQTDHLNDWSDGSDGQESLLPATSLHVTLSDSRQVELFHAHLPDVNNELGHLIGIRECGNADQELVTPSGLGNVHASTCDRNPVSSVYPTIAAELPVAHPAKDNPIEEREPSEVSSTTSSMSTSRCRRTEIPELLEIAIDVDVGDDNLKVQKLTLRFDISQALDDLQPPRLVDWVPCDMWCYFREWIQEQLNAQFNARANPQPCSHPVAFYLPARSANSREEVLLEPGDMAVELVEDDDSAPEDGDSEEATPLIARLRMRHFMQLNQNLVSRRFKLRHQTRKKSQGNAKSQTSELPAIEEVGDQ